MNILSKNGNTKQWEFPSLSLLSDAIAKKPSDPTAPIASAIQKVFNSFRVKAKLKKRFFGPSKMTFYLELGDGVRTEDVASLQNEIIRTLHAYTHSIEFTPFVEGTPYMSIIIPNKHSWDVCLKEMLNLPELQSQPDTLAVPLGIDVLGNNVTGDITKFPHALIAGETGSGKSMLLHTWICTLLMKKKPSEVRMILIDPKRVEFNEYNGLPHLLTPVILNAKKGLSAFQWALDEMERRYHALAETGVRDIYGYNALSGFQALPYILIIVDEFSDLMAQDSKKMADIATRLAQMARATGIHMILSTSRPNDEVYPPIFRANIPTRIAFETSSKRDSLVMLDREGAEKLSITGEMLYEPISSYKPVHVASPFISEHEIRKITQFLKAQLASPITPLPEDLLK